MPEHLPRERILYAVPCTCPKCGGPVRKLGEDVTETLECVPWRWKVVEHVREKVSCRRCEAISQPPAPSHPIARGRAGPHLLALVLAAKYGQHLPLTRQSAIYAGEAVGIDVSTLADWVGAAAASLMPLVGAIRAHVFSAERIHADDTTVPVLAKAKTRTGRLWVVSAATGRSRDRHRRRRHSSTRPTARPASRAAPRRLRRDHAGRRLWRVNRLYEPGRKPGPILEAACRVGGVVADPPLTDPDERISRIRFLAPELRSRRGDCGRSWGVGEGVARAWRGSAARTACCAVRAA